MRASSGCYMIVSSRSYLLSSGECEQRDVHIWGLYFSSCCACMSLNRLLVFQERSYLFLLRRSEADHRVLMLSIRVKF